MRLFPAVLTLFIALGSTAALADPLVSLPSSTSLAIYGDGRSVVREIRQLDNANAGGVVSIPGLPDELDVSSLSITIDGVPVSSLEIRKDTLSPRSLLQRSLGRVVTWLVPMGSAGSERAFTGTLVNVEGGIVLEIDGRFEAMAPGRLALDALPPGMSGGLEVQTILPEGKTGTVVVAQYLTPNLSWSADYEAILAPDAERLELSGYYVIQNDTVTNFEDSTVRLVAGDTTRLPAQDGIVIAESAVAVRALSAAPPQTTPGETTLGDVHVYDLPDTIRLAANRMTRRVLLPSTSVPVEKQYLLEGSGVVAPNSPRRKMEGLRPSVSLALVNDTGQALPAGAIRVFGALAEDGPQAPPVILGEAQVSHLPEGETAEIRLGRAFDVTAERRVVSYEITGTAQDRWRQPYRATHEITIRNGRSNDVDVAVQEFLNGRDWRIQGSSLPISDQDAGGARWTVPVPAGGKTVLTYTVAVTP